MMLDLAGNTVTATARGRDAYDTALLHLLSFRQTVGDDAQHACDVDPGAPMPVLLAAYLGLLSSEKGDAQAAGSRLRTITDTSMTLNDREHLHLTAVRQLYAGDLYGASATTARLNSEYPRDALAAFVGHQIDFFTGASQRLEARIAGVLKSWSDTDEYTGYLQGMWAFGLEEMGRYDEATDIGTRAVERHGNDAWAIHAVAHVNEMRGDFEQGINFLHSRSADWHTGTFLNVHIAWHNALFLLEREDWSGALELYDRFVRNDNSGDIALEMLDASALLWRLRLEDIAVGTRWESLAEGWRAKLDEPWYVFNDMHAVMAFVGAERRDDAMNVVAALEKYLASPKPSTNWEMTRRVGLPVCRAIVQHADGDFAATAETLEPVLAQLATFGGSHAQRDVVHRTFIDSLMKCGRSDDARVRLESRLRQRPASVWARKRMGAL
ncbi:MAG: tetratricopeptide repeat protein [Ilumatobacteraceae bacterium]